MGGGIHATPAMHFPEFGKVLDESLKLVQIYASPSEPPVNGIEEISYSDARISGCMLKRSYELSINSRGGWRFRTIERDIEKMRIVNAYRNSLAIFAAFLAAPAVDAAGPQTYSSRCSMCHQTTGAGLPGQFPRLAGRASQIAASPEGRTYLVRVLLYGIYGLITVDGKAINGLMPTMGSMSDQDIADVLNHVVSLKKVGKAAAFTAAEVAKVRSGPKATTSVLAAERAKLVAKGGFP